MTTENVICNHPQKCELERSTMMSLSPQTAEMFMNSLQTFMAATSTPGDDALYAEQIVTFINAYCLFFIGRIELRKHLNEVLREENEALSLPEPHNDLIEAYKNIKIIFGTADLVRFTQITVAAANALVKASDEPGRYLVSDVSLSCPTAVIQTLQQSVPQGKWLRPFEGIGFIEATPLPEMDE